MIASGGGGRRDATACVQQAAAALVSDGASPRPARRYVAGNSALGSLYRSDHLTSKTCCGLQPVAVKGVEDYDATAHVAPDSDAYHFAIPAVLEAVCLLHGESGGRSEK